MKVLHRFSIPFVLVLILQVVALSQPLEGDFSWYGDLPACITVENCSQQQIYVTIGDRNQGMIEPESSETYEVPYGDHKVIAEVWKLELDVSSYVRVSKFSPNGLWAVHDDDMK